MDMTVFSLRKQSLVSKVFFLKKHVACLLCRDVGQKIIFKNSLLWPICTEYSSSTQSRNRCIHKMQFPTGAFCPASPGILCWIDLGTIKICDPRRLYHTHGQMYPEHHGAEFYPGEFEYPWIRVTVIKFTIAIIECHWHIIGHVSITFTVVITGIT